jgi:hypothetical protein
MTPGPGTYRLQSDFGYSDINYAEVTKSLAQSPLRLLEKNRNIQYND